jgi:hypothetical protein
VADSGRIRIDIAFEGGMSLAVTVAQETADELDRALGDPSTDSVTFEAEDGRYTVSVKKIIFTKRSMRGQVVGFGAVGSAAG